MKKALLLSLWLMCGLFISAQVNFEIITKHVTDNTSLIRYKLDAPIELTKTGRYEFTLQTPMQFTSYAIGWTTETKGVSASDFNIFFRAHKPGRGWTEILEDEGYVNPENTITNIYQSDLLFGMDELLHDSLNFIIQPPAGVEISEVHLILMDISETVDLQRTYKYKEYDNKSCLEFPPIVPRSDWCGSYEDCHNPPNAPGPIDPTHIIVHYGYSPETYTDSYAVVRSYWNYHVNTNGWWDIGYNYLFDKYGKFFQGRHNVDLPYVNVRGVHAGAPNDYSVGICYLGNTDVTLPTPEQIEICLDFMAWWFEYFDIDPLSYADLPTNDSGNPWISFPRIIGHKDVGSTSCPGNVLYDMLPDLITQTAQKIEECGGLKVTTNEVTSITQTTAVSGGNITDDGGYAVTARGVVWSKTENPTIQDNEGITSDGTETGIFTSNITGLSPATAYYVRAYATNNEGTNYGLQRNFVTKATPCPGIETVNYGGHNYQTVQIGDQCWLAENLKYDNGCTGVAWVNSSDEGWCGCYNNDCVTHSSEIFGFLYQLSVAKNVCPEGWKLASDNDWKILEMELGMSQADADENDAWRDSGNVGSQLATWTSGGTNSSGFSAEQAGIRIEDGSFHGTDPSYKGAFLWSEDGIRRHIWHTQTGVNRQTNHDSRALSVRCIYDGTTSITGHELFKIQVYPNPAKDIVFVEFDVYKTGLAEISLIDVLGREKMKLENKNLIKGHNKFEFNVSNLTSGIYTVRVNYNNEKENEIINVKIIVN